MRTRDFTFKRKNFSLHAAEIDFSGNGIFLISGGNGSGKTSFFETILKHDNIVDISQIEKNRKISYCAQQLVRYSVTASEYLRDGKAELTRKYCEYFKFTRLQQDISLLSGGELATLAMIRCLSRDTPILVLDEPTNNMDDQTSEKVKSLLVQLSQNKKILLSTHDPRLDIIPKAQYTFCDGMIQSSVHDSKDTNNVDDLPNGTMLKGNLFNRVFWSKFHMLLFVFVLLCGVVTTIFTTDVIRDKAFIGTELPTDNYIALLYIAEPEDPYIRIHNQMSPFINNPTGSNTDSKQLINEYDTLDVDELLYLSQQKYIQDIYVVDSGYMNMISGESSVNRNFVSLPSLITDDIHYEGSYPGTQRFLISGRLPEDGKHEAVVSFQQLQKFWDYKGSINEAIGVVISMNNVNYKVVGLTNIQIGAISFDSKSQTDYGVIRVDENARGRLNQVLNKLKKQEYGSVVFENVFISYDKKNEHKLMDYLVQHSPSYQYSSNYVTKKMREYTFVQILPKALAVSAIITLIFCGLLIVIARKGYEMIYNMMLDYENCNFSKTKNNRTLVAVIFIDYIVTYILCIFLAKIMLSSIYGVLITLPFLIVGLLGFILTMWMMRRLRDRNA